MQFDTCRRLVAVAALCGALVAPVRVAAAEVLVFAAASLKTALDQITPEFEAATGQQVTVSFAASSVLARQIQMGAPADLFISANTAWMDVLERNGDIDPASRVDLVGNGLVLIVRAGQPGVQTLTPDFDLRGQLKGGYLAMALVDAVPAGIYGKAALTALGLWDDVQDQVAQADNVRAALALVASGAAPMGVVYRSDAQAEARVDVVGVFPEGTHPVIVYPAALTATARPEAQVFLDYLQSEPATGIFKAQGFTLPRG
ncbi:molybdate ABC transporter substrate-binding protein [Ruegeria arenilitoris]|uniref:molybdate ABC transporter substrate-binding protein n=1 Tax=Ruegeria arenilitoris TaxID=1173585 RepID=UPI001C98BA15|nr:molybdate ABC transporter substrate-binding protein [Ruegeria arenilitoris]MBY6083392.1 molybdate ABC transporter substrate-binding protein [Ruegeria arenilitoris]